MVGGLVEGDVQHRRPGDVLDGEVAGDLQLALAGGFDLGALEGRGRELEGVEERSEEHTSELQSLMRISYAVFCLKKKKKQESSNAHIQLMSTIDKTTIHPTLS